MRSITIPIVVVDDDEVDRYLVRRIVKSLGINADVVEYPDGEHFIEKIRDTGRAAEVIGEPPPPVLVLLDINMPRMGGFEVLDTLNEEMKDNEQIMFVTMYSSSNHAQDRSGTKEYPFVKDYLVKPATPERLTAVLDKLYPCE